MKQVIIGIVLLVTMAFSDIYNPNNREIVSIDYVSGIVYGKPAVLIYVTYYNIYGHLVTVSGREQDCIYIY